MPTSPSTAPRRTGAGTYRFFEPAMNAAVQARRSLEIDLRRALALKQFTLVFQPQIRLETGEVSGFEALLRWHHPERGLISPATFIPLAEDSASSSASANGPCAPPAARRRAGRSGLDRRQHRSPIQFRGGKLVETVTLVLAQTGLDPRPPRTGDHRGRPPRRHGRRADRAERPCAVSACGSRWTISAPATRRSAICRNFLRQDQDRPVLRARHGRQRRVRRDRAGHRPAGRQPRHAHHRRGRRDRRPARRDPAEGCTESRATSPPAMPASEASALLGAGAHVSEPPVSDVVPAEALVPAA